MDKARFDKGLEVRSAVLGKDYVEASMKNADDSIRRSRAKPALNGLGSFINRGAIAQIGAAATGCVSLPVKTRSETKARM